VGTRLEVEQREPVCLLDFPAAASVDKEPQHLPSIPTTSSPPHQSIKRIHPKSLSEQGGFIGRSFEITYLGEKKRLFFPLRGGVTRQGVVLTDLQSLFE
jgi:hypothetical protein